MNFKLQQTITYSLIFVLAFNPLLLAAQTNNSEMQRVLEADQKAQFEHSRAFANYQRMIAANRADDATTALVGTGGIQVDFNAAAIHQAGLKQAANGTQVVDIAQASLGGVSHNKFTHYNVSADGVILNNSLNPMLSILGGWTDGNRRLSGGTARIILAEVTGSSGSSLLGYSEILGDSAEFVLANQNGITCNGCGFINTPRVTFTTGLPEFLNGHLQGFNVSKGSVIFDGYGMNASNIGRLDILTQAIVLNASLYGDNLNLVTGLNYYDYTTGEVSRLGTQGGSVDFALDASILGGMYANNITLLGTEVGVGVRSEGMINAVQDMELTASGELRLKDTSANQRLTLVSTDGDIVTTGDTYGANVKLAANGTIINQGILAARDEIAIEAMDIHQVGDIYSGVDSEGKLQAGASLSIKAQGSIINQGSIVNVSGVELSADNITNRSDASMQSQHVDINTNSLVNQGNLSGTSLSIAGLELINSGHIQGEELNFNLDSLVAEQGVIYQYGELGNFSFDGRIVNIKDGTLVTQGLSDIKASDSIVNQGDWLAQGALNLVTDNFTNAGTLEAQSLATFDVNNLNNSGNLLFVAQQSPELAIASTLNNDHGLLQLNSDSAKLSASYLTNQEGQILHLGDGTLSLDFSEHLDNSLGKIWGSNLDLTSALITNNQGIIQGDTLAVKSKKLNNNQGVIVSFGREGESLRLDVEHELDNSEGVIQSFGDDLSLTSQSVNNKDGQIIHNGTGMFSVDTQELNNDNGLLWAEADLSIATPAFINRSGQVSAAGELAINTDSLSNHQGLILGDHVSLTATDVINDEGIVEAKQVLNINANGLSNLGGMIRADLMTLNAVNIDNQGSIIADILQLNALNLANRGSIMTRKAALTAAKLENNGLISAMLEGATDPSLNSELQLNTDKLVNHGSIMTDSHDVSLTNALIDNQGGTLVHSGQGVLTLNSLAEMNNAAGAIFTSGSLVLDATHLNNNQGVIQASKQAELNLDSMNNNSGKLAVLDAGRLAITLVDDLNNQEGNISAGQMAIAAKKLVNDGGSIQAFNDTTHALKLNLNNVSNLSEGNIASAGGMQIIAAELLNGGTLVSHGAMSLKLASLLNASASGIGAAALSLDVDNIINQGRIQARDTRINSVNISNQGQILNDGSLTLVTQSLDNSKGLLQVGGNTQIKAAKISNRAGEIVVTAGERLDINVSQLLDNSQGTIASNAIENHLQGTEINNTQGRLEFYQDLELSGGKLVNHQGLIAANEGYLNFNELDNTLSGHISAVNHLNIESDKLLSDGMLSAGTLTLNVKELEHKGGQILADTLSINTQSFNNSGVIASGLLDISAQDITNSGELNASQTLHLSATELNNLGGIINSQGNLIVEADTVLNREGKIYAGKLSLKGDTFVNDRGEIATFSSQDNSLAMSLTQKFDNQAGLIYVAGGRGTIEANTFTNSGEITYAGEGKLSVIAGMISNLDSAVLSSAAGLDIATEKLDNKGIMKAGKLAITSAEVENSGVMLAQNLDMTAQELNNGGIIEAGQGHLTLTNLINNGQLLASEQVAEIANPSLVIETQSLISKGIIAASELSIDSRVVDNQGDINSLKLTLTSESLNNSGNIILSGGVVATDNLTNRGKIALVGDGVLTLDAASNLDNQQGKIFSEGQLRLNTAALTNLDGLIQSAGGLGIVASEYDNTRGQLLGSGERLFQLDVGKLNNQAGVIATQRLAINAQAVDNTSLDAVFGQILASDMSLNTTELNNSHGLILADKLSVTAANLDNNQGRIEAKQSFLMSISQLLDNRQGELLVMAGKGDISAGSLNNDSGLIIHQGNGNLGLAVSETLQNDQGVISSAQQLHLSAASLDNRGGTLIQGGNGSLSFVDLFNQGGQIYGMGDLAVTGQSLDNSNGVLQVQGNADFTLKTLNNRAGELSAQGQIMRLQIADALDNQQGKLIAQGDLLQLQAGSINNHSGVLAASQQFTLNANSINNDAGFIRAEDKLTLQAQSMSNHAGGLLSGANVILSGQQLDNQSGVIESSNSLSLDFASLNNQSGLVLSKGQHFSLSGQFDNSQAGLLEVHSTDWQTEQQSINNQEGTLRHMGSGVLLLAQEQEFNNQSGTITSLGDIHLNLESGMNNQQGLVQASADIKLAALGNVDNRQGRLIAEGVMNVTAEGLDNRAGKVLAANGTHLLLSAELSNQDGLLYNQTGETNIIADTIDNANGVLTQQGNEAFVVKARALNNQGEISARNLLSIDSAKLQNHGVIGSTELTLKGQQLRNSGTLVAELLRLNATGLDNRDGIIYGSGSQGASLVLETKEQINNQSGLIQTKGQALTLAAGVDNTQGEILLLGNGALTAANVINDNGKLLSSGAMALSGNVSNQAGSIEALSDINIHADNLDNSAGSIHGNSQFTLTAKNLVNQAGRITGSGTVYRLDSHNIDNRNGGVIATNATDMLIKVNSMNNQAGTVMHQGSGKLTVAHAGASGTGVINNNAGTLVTQGQLDLLGNALSNDSGLISSQGSQGLTLASLSNTAGRIESAADLALVVSGNASNQRGIIFAANSLDLRTDGTLDNAAGVLLANTNAKLNAGSIVNDAGTVQAQTVNLHSLGRLSNQGGAISGTQVNLGATELNNTAGTILATGSGNNSLNMLAIKSMNNTQGTLASYAQNWDMVLNGFNNTAGKIVHQGRGALSLSNSGNLHNAGDIVSNGDLLLSASTVNNQGQLQAANRLNINGGLNNSASGVLVSSHINVAGGSQRIDNAGSLSAITSLNLNAAAIDNAGLLYSQQGLELTAAQIANAGTVSAANLTAKGFATLNNSGRIEANSASFSGTNLTNAQTGVLVASGTSATALILGVSQLVNRGTLYNSGVDMRFTGAMTNSGQLIHAGTGNLVIGENGSTDLSGGVLSTAGTANLKGNISGAGQLFAKKGINIDTVNTFTNTNSSLYTQGNLQINSALSNQGGTLVADGTLAIKTSGHVDNSKGVLQGSNIDIAAASLSNNQGTITSLGGGSGQIVAGSIDNTNGKIQSSNSQFTLNSLSGNLTNNSGVISHNGTGVLTLDSQGNLAQESGLIQTSGALQLRTSGDINNNNGVMLASKFDINASGAFSNASGQLIGFNDGNSTLTAAAIDNRLGTIANDGNSLSLLSQGVLDNTGGNISSSGSGSLNINASSIKNDNASSYVLANGAINIHAGSSLTNSGMISALTGLSVNAANINNSEMLASRNGAVTLNLSGVLTNTGVVSGKTAVDIQSGAINNTSGVLQSDGLVKLASQSLNVGQIYGQDLDMVLRGGLTLASSDKLSASRNITVNTNGHNINNQGNITASGLMNITGLNLTNGGRISAGNNSTLNFNDIANTGILSSNNSLTVNSNISNNSGTLAAANTLDINGHVNNSNLLFAGSNLTIDGNVTNSSSIYSAGNGALTGTITNNAGSIAAVNNLSLSGIITNNRSGTTTFVQGETKTTTSGGKPSVSREGGMSSSEETVDFDRITKTTTIYNATATGSTGIIAAGGDLSLSGDITNNYSTISAGRNINLSGTNLTNNTAQNKEISDVSVVNETWSISCRQGKYKGRVYVCSEPGHITKQSESAPRRYTETTYTGGAFGTIVAGGSISGNLSGKLEANDASPQTGDRYSANTQVSGTQGSASRGKAASANNQQIASISTTNGSSQSIAGQSRNASAQTANVNAAVNLSEKNETVNGTNSLSLVGGADNSVRASATTRDINQNIASNDVSGTAVRGLNPRADFTGQDALSIAGSVNGIALNLMMQENISQVHISSAGVKTSVSTVVNGPVIDPMLDQYQQSGPRQATASANNSDYQLPAQAPETAPSLTTDRYPEVKLEYVNGVEQINQDPLLGKNSHIAANREQHEHTALGGLGVNAQAPEHKYQRAEGETQLSGQDLLRALDTLSNLENEAQLNHEGRNRNAQGNHLTAMAGNSANVFMTDEQVKVLTQGLGFDQSIIDDGQNLLYAVIGQNDLLVDGVTISAGTYMDISADKGIKIDAGIAANDGLILRTQGDIATLDTTYFDSAKQLGLQMGGDFTNSANLISDNLWLDVGGNFINDASLTGNNQLWLNSGGDFTNNANLLSSGLLSINAAGNLRNQQGLIAGSDVMLNAGGDIINRTEFSQHTHKDGLNSSTYTFIGKESKIFSSNSLSMNAGNNIDLQGSSLAANGDISLSAVNDVLLSAVENKRGRENYFRGGYEITHDTTYNVVDLQAGGNLAVIAGNNLLSEGALFSAAGDVSLAAGNTMDLLAVTESHIESSQTTKKSTFKKKVTTQASQHDTVQGTAVLAGGDVLINARKNADGSMSVQQSGDVNLHAALLQSGGDMVLAGNDINLLAQSYTDYEMTSVSKKSFGGLKSKASLDAEKTQKLAGSELASGGDLSLLSADDITIGGSALFAAGDINLASFDELLISSGEETSQVENMRKKGGFLSGGSLYSSKENMNGETATTAYSSLLNASGNINIDAGSARVVGSDIVASGSIGVRTDIGDIEVLAAKESKDSYFSERKLEVGFGDLLKGLANPTELIKVENGQLKLSIANASYDKVDFSSTENSHKASTLAANGSLTLNSVADILVEGSDLLANNGADANVSADSTAALAGDLNLLAGGNITIKEAENSYEEKLEETHGEAELSIVVQNQAVEVVKAALALKEATDKVKQSEQDYRTYKKQRGELESQLAQLEADYNSGAPGVNYADIIDMRELLADVNSDEDWYIAGIALATANVVSKTTGLAQQSAAAAQSTATYGFNAGLQLDIDASNTKSELEQTSSLASTLSGNNINILTGLAQGGERGAVSAALGMTLIQGSHLNAKNAINISTGELSVLASRDTSSSSSETQNGHITIAQTVWGAESGPTVNASYDRNQTKDKTTNYNNATLTAADINIITAGDTRIEGANLSADNRLNLDVGGDLLLESKQNRASGSNKGFGVSGGISLGGKDEPGIKGLNGGFNTSNGRYQNKETVLSSITGAEVKVNVAGNTNIVGALLASLNSEGKDNGQLSLTTGSLSFTDLSNTGFNSQQSMGLTTSVGVSRTGISGGSSTFTYSNESSYDKSKTLATIGQGTVTVGDAGAADSAATTTAALAGLNRDSSNLTKEFYSVDRQQGNIDITVDHRLLSEEGRKQIGEDFKRTELLAGSIADIATEESVTIGDTFQHIGDVQKDLDVQKLMATQDGGENALILNDLANATPEQKQQALDAYAVAYAEIYDISIDEAKVITNKQYRGASFTEDGSSRIYVSDSEQDNALDYAETIGHEVAHVQIEQGAIRDRGDLNEDYAKLRGTYAAQNYDFNFSHNNLGIVNTGNTNNHVGNNSSELIRRNNKSFSGEDSTQGEFYLSKGQQAVYDNALTACDGNVVCQATTEAKYVYISAKQDVALNTGVVEGVGKEVVDEVLGLIDVLKDPGQVVDSFKAILEDPTILASVAESEVDEVKKLIADFEIQYEAAEWDGANLAGEDLGRLTAKVVGLIGGVTAAAKVTKSVVTKVGGQLDTVALQGTTNKAEIIVEPSRLLEYKVDKNALFTSDRVSVVVDEKSFIEYYVDKDFEGNTIYDINGSFVLKNEISIPPGKYMTFTEDVAGKGIAETRSILSINGKTTKTQVGYEMYDGQNYRIDFDIVGQLNKLNIPAFNSNYLNDIGGPAAFGGGRQRVNNEPMIISPSLNPIFHRFDGISIPKYNNLSRDAKVKLKGSEYVK